MCPEMGHWSTTKRGNSSEAIQAAVLTQMFQDGLAAGVNPLMWFKVYDDAWPGSNEDTELDETMGLRRLDRSLKPAYFAYKNLANP